MPFPAIQGPSDPEEFSWEVILSEEQSLRSIDSQLAEVEYEDGTEAELIEVEAAHDAGGVAVPTSLAVSGGNVITLTVHHRAGNPLADGAPFDYPVLAGSAFKVSEGIVTVEELPAGELEEADQRVIGANPPFHPTPLSPPSCSVPRLRGLGLREAKRLLRAGHCKLGAVAKAKGTTAKSGRVVEQSQSPGKLLPKGSGISIKLAG